MTPQPPGLPAPKGNVIRQTIQRAKLVWRLMRDPRVPWLLKLIPVGGLIYVVFPFDLIIDFAPIIGQVDDVGIFLGSLWLFTELCPANVVQEHWNNLTAVVPGAWREVHGEDLIERTGEQQNKKQP